MSSIRDFKGEITVSFAGEGSGRIQTISWRQIKSNGIDGNHCFFWALKQMAMIAEVCGIAEQAKETFAQEVDEARRRLREEKESREASQ